PSRLPKKDNPRRALWLENSRRRDASGEGRWDPASKYIYFCSQHFEKSCFEIVGFSQRGGGLGGGGKRGGDISIPPPNFNLSFSPHRRDPPPSPGTPPFPSDALCFPRENKDPGAPPAGDHGGVPALPGPSGARGPLQDNLVVTTGDEEATATPDFPESDPPAPPRPVSPSLYMLRLPPPAGAYIQSEHSYQVGSALLWKR
ncbi:THAP7 protein, partial [Syrrhaptes paradoxus]|nr:THAP7 protein [Syrrhaptes paradoxus]